MKGTLTKTPEGWAVKYTCNDINISKPFEKSSVEKILILHAHDHPEMDSNRFEGKEVEFEETLCDWSLKHDISWSARLHPIRNTIEIPGKLYDMVYDIVKKADMESDKLYGEYTNGTQLMMHSVLAEILKQTKRK